MIQLQDKKSRMCQEYRTETPDIKTVSNTSNIDRTLDNTSNKHIDRTFELTSDAPTNAEMHVTSNIACERSQQNTTYTVV